MKNALQDILLSTVAVLIGLFLAHFYLRQVGLSRPIAEIESAWWSNRFIVSEPVSLEDLNIEKFYKLQTSDLGRGILFLPCVEVDYAHLDSRLKSLQKVLHDNSHLRLLINVTSYTPNIDKKIDEIVTQENAVDRVIIKSPYDNIVKEIKRHDPKMTVGSGKGEASRMLILASISLEALPPLIGDFYFIDTFKSPKDIPQRLLSELRRRHIAVIVEAPNSEAVWQTLLSDGITGVIVPSAEAFSRWFQALKI